MANDMLNLLHQSVRMQAELAIQIVDADHDAPRHVGIETPFAVIGRSSRADLRLKDPSVSFRHAYMQVLQDGVFCVDLGSKGGIYWGTHRRSAGWLSEGETLRVQTHHLSLETSPKPESALSARQHKRKSPLKPSIGDVSQLPRYVLEIVTNSGPSLRHPIDRLVTLVGRSEFCSVHLPDESVSRVHCSLLLTPAGLWVIDLLGKDGTFVNGKDSRYALLEHWDLLNLGRYKIRVQLEETTADLRDEPAEAIQSATEEESSAPASAAIDEHHATGLRPVSDMFLPERGKEQMQWLGSLFQLEWEPETMIVLPTFSGGAFRYTQLHTETNALRHRLDDDRFRHLVIDLRGFDYIGSEGIGAVSSLARQVTARGGRAAFCRAAPEFLKLLSELGLLQVWPHFLTRDQAVRFVREG